MWQEETARIRPDDRPLIRGQLIGVGDEEHVLQLTMHHIVSDGWSVRKRYCGNCGHCMQPIAPGTPILYRRCRFNTPTMHSGSGSGSSGRPLSGARRGTGRASWRERRSGESSRVIECGLRCRTTAGARSEWSWMKS